VDFYSTLVQCTLRLGRCALVETLLDDMVQQQVPRPLTFYEGVMKQLASQKQFSLALRVNERLVQDGLEPSLVTCSCLVSFAAEIGDSGRAVRFFAQLAARTTPSIRAYMTILRVHSKRNDWAGALGIFRDMQQRGCAMDSLVLNNVLATGVAADELIGIEELLGEAETLEPPLVDVVTYNTVIKGYARQNCAAKAVETMARMRRSGLRPNSITYNTVLDAAVRDGDSATSAWDLLEEMRLAGLQPDKFTCSIMVKGLSRSPSLEGAVKCADLLQEVNDACDPNLRKSLYHSLLEAAEYIGDVPLLARVGRQMAQHGLGATQPMQRRLALALGKKVLVAEGG